MAVKVGDKASRTMTVTADHVRAYGEMTGDYNSSTRASPAARSSGGWWFEPH